MNVTFEGQPFPQWSVRPFYPNLTTVTYEYRDGKLEDATFSQVWYDLGGGKCSFTRDLDWFDEQDMQLLRMETGLALKHATDLTKMKGNYCSPDFVLHAVDQFDCATLIIQGGTLQRLGFDPDGVFPPDDGPDRPSEAVLSTD